MWRAIYLGLMPGWQKKVRVALDWTLDLFFSKDIVQLPTLQRATMSEADLGLPTATIGKNAVSKLAGDYH
jgi:NADH dehydrogenase